MKARRKRNAEFRYPGWLGKVTRSIELAGPALDAARKYVRDNPAWTDAQFDAAYQDGWNEAMQKHGYRVLFAVMELFGIDPHDKQWAPKLAWKLVALHVPASKFEDRKGRGRPKSTARYLQSLYLPPKREIQRQRREAADEEIEDALIRGAVCLEKKGMRYSIQAAFVEAAKEDGLSGWRASKLAKSRASQWSKVRRRLRRRMAEMEMELAKSSGSPK